MQILPIKTPTIQPGDDLTFILLSHAEIQDGDILVLSSKAVAMAENALINLSNLEVSEEANQWAEKLHRTHPDPPFRQAVLEEAARLNGRVISDCPHAMLTELKPDGLEEGTILAANAGLDRSNVPEGYALGWPQDPVHSADVLRESIEESVGGRVTVIIGDSCCRPRRIGVTAFALAVSGMDPLVSHVGDQDLFDRDLRMTKEAVADQLTTAANAVMGNAAESVPAAIIRDHHYRLSDFSGWVPGIEPEEDLFKGSI